MLLQALSSYRTRSFHNSDIGCIDSVRFKNLLVSRSGIIHRIFMKKLHVIEMGLTTIFRPQQTVRARIIPDKKQLV